MSEVAGGNGLLEVRVSVPDAESAQRIAREVVEQRLAACVQVIGPVTSVYSWEGEVHQATEWLLLMKTTESATGSLTASIVTGHSYEVPEVMAVPVTYALEAYERWVRERVTGPAGGTAVDDVRPPA